MADFIVNKIDKAILKTEQLIAKTGLGYHRRSVFYRQRKYQDADPLMGYVPYSDNWIIIRPTPQVVDKTSKEDGQQYGLVHGGLMEVRIPRLAVAKNDLLLAEYFVADGILQELDCTVQANFDLIDQGFSEGRGLSYSGVPIKPDYWALFLKRRQTDDLRNFEG